MSHHTANGLAPTPQEYQKPSPIGPFRPWSAIVKCESSTRTRLACRSHALSLSKSLTIEYGPQPAYENVGSEEGALPIKNGHPKRQGRQQAKAPISFHADADAGHYQKPAPLNRGRGGPRPCMSTARRSLGAHARPAPRGGTASAYQKNTPVSEHTLETLDQVSARFPAESYAPAIDKIPGVRNAPMPDVHSNKKFMDDARRPALQVNAGSIKSGHLDTIARR